jgi:hypothetical protein
MAMDNRVLRPIKSPEPEPPSPATFLVTLSNEPFMTISGFALRTIQNV